MFRGEKLKKMNTLNTKAKEYYKKTESFMNKIILYIKMLYTQITNLLEINLQKARPYVDIITSNLSRAKGFIMDLFFKEPYP